MSTISPIRFAFFGSSRLSVIVLDELEKLGYVPACIITTPDKPQGRTLTITPNIVKVWALQHGITVYDPATVDASTIGSLKQEACAVFVVASYSKLLPKTLIDIPPRKTLNIHPSLLPAYRGAAPLPYAMLDDAKHTGVSIMRIDEFMDHGPLIGRAEVTVAEWPTYEKFEELMAREGARLLASVLPDWVAGRITEQPQDHRAATFTKKITKEDGLIDFKDDPYLNFRKIQAYHSWPQAYFFIEHKGRKMRIKITSASYVAGKLLIQKVIPEGSKEMDYKDFAAGYDYTPPAR